MDFIRVPCLKLRCEPILYQKAYKRRCTNGNTNKRSYQPLRYPINDLIKRRFAFEAHKLSPKVS